MHRHSDKQLFAEGMKNDRLAFRRADEQGYAGEQTNRSSGEQLSKNEEKATTIFH